MSRTNRLELTLASAVAFLMAGSLAPHGARSARAEDPPAATSAAKNEEAAKYLLDFKTRAAKQDEVTAGPAIKRLLEIWNDKEVLPETKKPVPDLLGRVAKESKGVVAVAAINALSEVGPEEGGKELREVLDRALKAKEPSPDIYGAALRGLKKLADPSKATVDLLAGLLVNKENEVVAKAADAISGYKDAPGKVRRELMEEMLIKAGEPVYAASLTNKNAAATMKWQTIQSSVMAALNALSGQSFADPAAARKWFNDHKKDKIWS